MSSGIGGEKRIKSDFVESVKRVGLFEGSVIAINPTTEQYKDLLNIELKEDSKAAEYIGESKDGNTTLRLSIWLKDVKTEENFNVSFYLEDKERENKDKTKKQYINQIGMCTWASDEDGLADWFKGTSASPKDYRVAYVGEEEMYDFLRTWLSELDYRSDGTILSIDWKKLMRGNVKELTSQINGEFCGNVVAMATVTTREKDGEIKEYQSVYNKGFLPAYCIKQFRIVDYNDSKKISFLAGRKPKDLKLHEKFVVKVTGEYGCKDFYSFSELQNYDPEMNMVASDRVIAEDDADY